MGSVFTIAMAFLVVFASSPAVLPNTKQQTNTRQNRIVKQNSDSRQTRQKNKPLDFSDTGRPGQQTAGERGDNSRFSWG